METKNIIFELRNQAGMSQDELAEKVYVTRQAVSRWENGETTPNTETSSITKTETYTDGKPKAKVEVDGEGKGEEDPPKEKDFETLRREKLAMLTGR